MSRNRILAIALFGAAFLANGAFAAGSSLERALDHLQAARNALEQGGRKEGHRKQALDSVNQAIEHVRKGLDEEKKQQQKTERKEERQQERATDQEKKQLQKSTQQEQEQRQKTLQQEQRQQEKTAEELKKQEKKAKE